MRFNQLGRREFIKLFGGTAVDWPLAARAQQSERMRRVGVLLGAAEGDPIIQNALANLLRKLKEAGWETGRSIGKHLDE
jgi:putative ABC transport system substrate-binding protein